MNIETVKFSELTAAVKAKKISALETAQFYLGRIEKLNPKLNAFIKINPELLNDAKKIDNEIAKGNDPGPLAGVVFGIKDMLCTKNLTTTAGSKMLENFVPPYDATVVARLRKAGALIAGKLNQDEFAMGSSNETSAFGVCKNPWNLDYVPGGSSGGSAAAQAARLVMGTIGTDTGGSIRQPANFCGITGIKPTYGRVSRYGIVAYASSLDQAGPMTSNIEDAALTLESICGIDRRDMTTSDRPVESFSNDLNASIKGKKIGIVKEYISDQIDPDVEKTFQNAIETLKKAGAEFVEVSIPMTKFAVPMYYLISASEASSNLSRYDGVKYGYRSEFKDLSSIDLVDFYSQTRSEGFGTEVKRRIMLGTYCLSSGYYDAYYKKACQVRRILKEQYAEAFKTCDALLSPVSMTPAFKIGERSRDPLKMYMNDIFTTATNLAGLTGLSVPFGISSKGLPIGLQLTGWHFQEKTILNLAQHLENNFSAKGQKPSVF
jgi:aspartyl-tRNA(Asn)/glutamyl-tRNA(Gln) amidotransferase subunit A